MVRWSSSLPRVVSTSGLGCNRTSHRCWRPVGHDHELAEIVGHAADDLGEAVTGVGQGRGPDVTIEGADHHHLGIVVVLTQGNTTARCDHAGVAATVGDDIDFAESLLGALDDMGLGDPNQHALDALPEVDAVLVGIVGTGGEL